MPRRCVAYVRVSTDDQSISLEAQQDRIRAHAVAMGYMIDDVVIDSGASAKTLRRPGMQRILDELRSGEIGTVVVLKLDRLTRSVRDLGTLLELFEQHDVHLVAVAENLDTGTAAGRLMLHLLASVSQWERETIAERTSFALEHKRRRGKVYGKTPFGFCRVGDDLVPHDREQDALAAAVAMRRTGKGWTEIGAMLTERGARPHQGKTWYPSSVRAMLTSKRISASDDAFSSPQDAAAS